MKLNRIKQDFPYHQNEDDDFYVSQMAKSYQYCGVHNFDFSNSNVSYNAILDLWRSDGIGYYIGNGPQRYDDRYNKLISTVYIEIQKSSLHTQYQLFTDLKDLFKFPYRDPFLIDTGDHQIVSGLKEIILTIHGQSLFDQTHSTGNHKNDTCTQSKYR